MQDAVADGGVARVDAGCAGEVGRFIKNVDVVNRRVLLGSEPGFQTNRADFVEA